MITVVAHTEHALDHLGDPQRRPQIGVVPVNHGAAQQCAQQACLLAGGETSRASGGGEDLEAGIALPFVRLHPAHHRTGRASEATGDGVQRQPFLHQALAERPTLTGEQRSFGRDVTTPEELHQQPGGRAEQGTLRPRTALQTPDDDSRAIEVEVATREQRHLSHPEAVEVDQREQRPIARVRDRGEEPLDFRLGEIPRQLRRAWNEGKRRRGG